MRIQYDQQFKEAMEQLARRHERSKVYVDFMNYYIQQNSNSPGQPLLQEYTDDELPLFQEAYTGFKKHMTSLINEYGWYDYIGEYYEEYVLAGSKASKKGQFYTPRQISHLLSDLCGYKIELAEAYDPTCGSARNLLDYHSRHPSVRLTGEDLDESACKMAVINFHLHDVDGYVHWIDALTREYMGTSWRIRGGRIYVTDMEWIRATEDILSTVSLLSLSDESFKALIQELYKKLPITDDNNDTNTDDVTEPEKEGLDKWMKKR